MARPKQTLEARLQKASLLLNNAVASAEIIEELATFNYPLPRIQELQSLYSGVVTLNEKQKKEYSEQYLATSTLDELVNQADLGYKKNLKLARLVFRNNPAATGALLLNGSRKISISGFIEQTGTFYNNLLADQSLLQSMATYNVKIEDLQRELELVGRVKKAFEVQQKERGDAVQATKNRDNLLDRLDSEISDLTTICKIAFEDRANILLALGI